MKEFRQSIPEGMNVVIEGRELVYIPIETKCPFEIGDIISRGECLMMFTGVSNDGYIMSKGLLNTKNGYFNSEGTHFSDDFKQDTKATPEQESLFNQKCLENNVWFDRDNEKWIELKEGGVYFYKSEDIEAIFIFKSFIGLAIKQFVSLLDNEDIKTSNNALTLLYNLSILKIKISEATEEQKKQLFDALAKEGKQWNAEKRCVEDVKWKPNHGDYYFMYDFWRDEVTNEKYHGHQYAINRISMGNCFKTKEECKKYAEYMKQCSLNYKPE